MRVRSVISMNVMRVLLAGGFFVAFCLAYIIIKTLFYTPPENSFAYRNRNFEVLGLNVPSDLNFCGEKLPANDFGIKRAIEKEFFTTAYWKSTSVILFNRAQRWFPYIDPILKKEGIPLDFRYVAVIESHLTNCTSPAGAAGFWQLVPSSARHYGLEVNDYVDERYDVEKATRAACKHLREAYGIFRNWTLTAAAYNRGIGGIQAAMRNQKATTYFDLLLNPETGAFVYRILAYKTLFSNPEFMGIKRKLRYVGKPAYKVLKVDSSITDLTSFAKRHGTNIVALRCFNPWLLRNSLPNPAGKQYEIRIPKNLKGDYSGYAKDLIPVGDPLTPYVIQPELSEGVDHDTLLARKIMYVVKISEPIDKLARFLKVSAADLRKWNGLDENAGAVEGQTLTVFYKQ